MLKNVMYQICFYTLHCEAMQLQRMLENKFLAKQISFAKSTYYRYNIFLIHWQVVINTLEFFIIEKHISLIQRERLSTMRLVNCSSENNTHSSRKTVTYIYDMRPTIHSQEYPIKFNLKLPFQLRKKEEEQRRLKSV